MKWCNWNAFGHSIGIYVLNNGFIAICIIQYNKTLCKDLTKDHWTAPDWNSGRWWRTLLCPLVQDLGMPRNTQKDSEREWELLTIWAMFSSEQSQSNVRCHVWTATSSDHAANFGCPEFGVDFDLEGMRQWASSGEVEISIAREMGITGVNFRWIWKMKKIEM